MENTTYRIFPEWYWNSGNLINHWIARKTNLCLKVPISLRKTWTEINIETPEHRRAAFPCAANCNATRHLVYGQLIIPILIFWSLPSPFPFLMWRLCHVQIRYFQILVEFCSYRIWRSIFWWEPMVSFEESLPWRPAKFGLHSPQIMAS